MRKLFLTTTILASLFTACKKSDNNSNNNTGLNSGQFKVGATTYSDVFLSSSLGYLSAISPTGGGLQMTFFQNTLPTTSGTFKVVTDADAADEIEIIASSNASGATKTYVAGNVSGQTATVTVSNGKYTVQFSDIDAANVTNNTETTKVSANVSQN
jgi:hypothetical protein